MTGRGTQIEKINAKTGKRIAMRVDESTERKEGAVSKKAYLSTLV